MYANGNDGFFRRWTYPDAEDARNHDNYIDAVSRLDTKKDDFVSRIFWDPK